MSAEVGALIAAELEDPDRLLSEALYVRVSPELKQELVEYAGKRRVSLAVVLMEAVAQLERRSEGQETQVGLASPAMGNGHRKRGRPAKPGPEFPLGISNESQL
jgi:predicted transcriptional regulator